MNNYQEALHEQIRLNRTAKSMHTDLLKRFGDSHTSEELLDSVNYAAQRRAPILNAEMHLSEALSFWERRNKLDTFFMMTLEIINTHDEVFAPAIDLAGDDETVEQSNACLDAAAKAIPIASLTRAQMLLYVIYNQLTPRVILESNRAHFAIIEEEVKFLQAS